MPRGLYILLSARGGIELPVPSVWPRGIKGPELVGDWLELPPTVGTLGNHQVG